MNAQDAAAGRERELIAVWREDPRATYRAWFLGEERLKNFRSIRRGLQAVIDEIERGAFVRGCNALTGSRARLGRWEDFLAMRVVVVLTQTPVSERARRMRLTSSLAAGCLLYSAGYGWVGFAEGFASLAAAVVLVTLGEVMVSPALQTMAANLAPEEMRGRYLGFQSLALQLGAAFGPLLGGLGLQVLSPRWSAAPWLAVAAVGAAAAFGFRSFGLRLGPAEDGTFDPQLSRSKGAS